MESGLSPRLQLTDVSILKAQKQVNPNAKDRVQDYVKNIESGTEVKFYFERLLFYDGLLTLMTAFNIALTLLYYDSDYQLNYAIAQLTLYIMTGILLFSISLSVMRYQTRIALSIAQKEASAHQTLLSSDIRFSLLLEIGVLLLQPYPFLNSYSIETRDIYDKFSFQFKVNYVMVLLGFLRLFIVVRVILLRTNYMSPRASRNCNMYGCRANYLFAVKCLFKDSPMTLMGIVFFVSVIVFALGLRITQRNLNIEYPKHFGVSNPQDLENFGNSVWLTIITMTTVGYGDYFPRTTIGRVIDIVLVVWGIFIVSLMVVVLTNALNMDPNESRALIVLNRLQAKKVVKEKAANLIGASYRRHRLILEYNKQQSPQERERLTSNIQSLEIKLNSYSKDFQTADRQIRSMYELDNVYEEMTRQFEFINDEVGFLTDNQTSTINCLKDYLLTRQTPAVGED